MNAPTGALLLLSLASLAGCGSSSKSSHDGGFVTGGDGAAGVGGAGGAGTGSPMGGAGTGGGSGSPMGTGGSSGGYAGSGGTGGTPPPACSDPNFPLQCPALGDVPSTCWSAGTDCSTITRCGDSFRSCTMPGMHFDCLAGACVFGGGAQCGGPFPVACPALGDVPALCWSAGTICSTISRCGNDFKSCLGAGYRFDCMTGTCVPFNGPIPDAAPVPDGSPSAPDAPPSTSDVPPASSDVAAPTSDVAGDAQPG